MKLLFVGRCVYDKGVDLLPLLHVRLHTFYPCGIHLAIAGTGPLASPPTHTLEQLNILTEQSVSTCARLGRQDHIGVQQLYAWADVMVMPSRMIETFGMSALEAIDVGIPVIGPRIGGLTQFVHPQLDCAGTGCVSLDGLTNVVLSYVQMSNVDRQMLHLRCLDKARAYSSDRWCENVDALLCSMIENTHI